MSYTGDQFKETFNLPREMFTQRTNWHPLIKGSFLGDYDLVENLLKQDSIDVNLAANKEQYTALMAASARGHIEIIKLLIKHGAKIDLVNSIGATALMIACQSGQYSTVILLLESGARPNRQDKQDHTALMVASNNGNYRIAELLLKHKAKVNMRNDQQRSALMLASYSGHYDLVELLLKHKAQIDTIDKYGFTAVMHACCNRHYEVVKLLLKHNAKLNISANGESALTLASQQYSVAKLLIEKLKGSNDFINILNHALLVASDAGHYAMANLLIESGASVSCRDAAKRQPPLIIASHKGHYETSKLLLEKGAEVDVRDSDGYTPLMRATQSGHSSVVKLLLMKGARVNIQSNDSHFALLLSSSQGWHNIVELLLDNGAQPNLQGSVDGRSALIAASLKGHFDISKLLLKRGATTEILDKEGKSALTLAANSKTARLLLESGATVNRQDSRGHSALIEVCERGDYDTAVVLLEGGAKVDLQTKTQATALMKSCSQGHYDVTKLLLDHRANPNLQDIAGLSSFHYATKSGNTSVAKLLLARGAQPNLRSRSGEHVLQSAGNVEMVNLVMENMDVDRKDLFKALQNAVSFNNSSVVRHLFGKCLVIIAKTFCLNTDPIFPGIAFFKSEVRNRITSSGATVESTGLSVSIPAGTLREEDSTDLLIRPCFSGPFELPAEYVSASPAYLIQLSGRVTIQKDVTIRMHHYANLKTEEDCEDMVFLSASSIPQKDMSTMVYRFKRITGARILFRPGIPVGDITLRHFCLLKVARWIGRMSRHYLVGPGSNARYCARLYRNLFPNAFSDGVSAVFCVCLDQPLYIEHCDSKIRGYYAFSDGNEAADLSVEKGTMVSDEIVISDIPTAGWKVSFDKRPPKIFKTDLDVPLGRDYPPQFAVFVRQTSIHDHSELCVPELRVAGLDKGDRHFKLVIPGRASSDPSPQSSHQLQGSEISASLCEDTSESKESRRKAQSTLTHRNVLTELVDITTEWRNIGLSLDISYPSIEKIEKEYPRDLTRCLEEVIDCWLKGNGGEKSWNFLCKALRSKLVLRPNVASDIEKEYAHTHAV